MMKTVYSGYYSSNGHPFNYLADEVVCAEYPDDMVEKDSCLVIWGGSDISPSLYGHPQSRTTYPAPKRDQAEWALIQRAIEMGIPIVGVCRGAQMLCAAAGGSLLQDVQNHAGRAHLVSCSNGDEFAVNSIHHQMLCLDGVDHELLAWSKHQLSKKYIWKDDQEYVPTAEHKEPELVVFPKIKGFAIQWHPEAMSSHSAATLFIYDEFNKRYSRVSA